MTYSIWISVYDDGERKYTARLVGDVSEIDKAYARVSQMNEFTAKELIQIFDNAEKFEAALNWLIKAKLEGRISMNAGFSLGLVLGVEET